MSNLWIALRIILIKPITEVTGEKSFSKQKFIKVYLQPSMARERLNSLTMLSIKKSPCKIDIYRKCCEKKISWPKIEKENVLVRINVCVSASFLFVHIL